MTIFKKKKVPQSAYTQQVIPVPINPQKYPLTTTVTISATIGSPIRQQPFQDSVSVLGQVDDEQEKEAAFKTSLVALMQDDEDESRN